MVDRGRTDHTRAAATNSPSRPSGRLGAPQRRLISAAVVFVVLAVAVAFVIDRGGDERRVDAGAGGTKSSVSVSVTTDGSATSNGGGTETSDGSGAAEPTVAPPPAHDPPAKAAFENQGIRLVATISIPLLTGMIWSPGEDAYFAISQDGKVFRVDSELTGSEVVLDLTSQVSVFEKYSERGLLGIAFDPRDGRMFLDYTDRDSDTHVVSYALVDGKPDPATIREVLVQDQPGLGHKGGQLAFDATGNLYISFGDGGGSKGRDAQDMTKWLGAIVRVTPKLDADGYTVPDSNPFVGDAAIAPEIYVKGLRNPWRFSIDPPTGDIWIGDVGEKTWEEVDVIPAGTAGQNFGWYFREGAHDYTEGSPGNLTEPVFEYRHDEYGPAVIGGFVYHGSAIPSLAGAYVFADMSGPMFALGADYETVRLNVAEQTDGVITSFVVTPEHEFLIVTQNDAIFRVVAA